VSGAVAGEPFGGVRGPEPGGSGRRHAVFISDFIHLGLPFPQLAASLLDPGGPWLAAAQRSAAQQRFTVTAGEPRQFGTVVIVPMHWEPMALERLVPALDADIELSSLGADHCRLSLSGRYRPPVAPLHAGVDRSAMHRVAEASVRDFLAEIAVALQSPRTPKPPVRVMSAGERSRTSTPEGTGS